MSSENEAYKSLNRENLTVSNGTGPCQYENIIQRSEQISENETSYKLPQQGRIQRKLKIFLQFADLMIFYLLFFATFL